MNSFKIIVQSCIKASGSFAMNQIKSCLYVVHETRCQLRNRLGRCWLSRLKNMWRMLAKKKEKRKNEVFSDGKAEINQEESEF